MFHLKIATKDDKDISIKFIMEARKILFPMLDHSTLPKDLANFEQSYIESDNGCWINYYDEDKLIATIAFVEFDFRFKDLDLDVNKRTVEVLKLYVDPLYRRQGIATLLFNELKKIAKERSIQILYLHTHDFLTGAQKLWEKCGFKVIKKDDSNWATVHMVLELA
ncbi:GNAT family N-acetyltransferase [Ureaplasma diversum]|uniref:N-acetyltransferase domain-containing protein n=1 Tax=Ureaplasma diversum NCTC 246 TaxID=1188241 RepID=A0A084F109_9BACT|nr:GNAT family N-acetyltransferase [Ureaplasma diversum]KEZ23901.1 Hypothetical protein, predicted acetyltransferase [Ureaplasma diversum NCTC 246]